MQSIYGWICHYRLLAQSGKRNKILLINDFSNDEKQLFQFDSRENKTLDVDGVIVDRL